MVTPNASALGRPSELDVSSVTSIIGANDNTSAQVSSRKAVCVWAAMAVAIMIAEGLLVGYFQPKPMCEFKIGGSTIFADAHVVLPADLLLPFFSGALVTLFASHRHRYIAGSKLHFWTLCYAVAAFVLSWSFMLTTLCRCNQRYKTFEVGFRGVYYVFNSVTALLFFWLSVLKLRCLKTVAPSLVRVGELIWLGLIVAVPGGLLLIIGTFVREQPGELLLILAEYAAWGFVIGAGAFFGVVVMVLRFSANSALNEASQSDVDDESARHFKISASWTKWTMIASAWAGSSYCASLLLWIKRKQTPGVIIASFWAWAIDQLTNHAASGLLSGILFGDVGPRSGSVILKDVAASVHSQRRRTIEQQLISAVGVSAGSALTVVHLMDAVAPIDALREAELRFRCITWEVLAARCDVIIGGGLLHVIGPGGDDLYSLSEPCHLGDCDAFVSHSWSDNGLQKWEALRSWCDDFVQAQGYQPRLWIDKLCISQTEIVTDLRCLPVFIAGCKRLLIISGPTYPTRLWCAMEVLVHRAILASDANRCPPELLLLGDDKQRNDLQQAWSNFDVVQCNCFISEDKRRFLGVVGRYPGGSTGFNRFVREFAADLPASSEASSSTDAYDFVVRC
eukprot:TRINITY_DN6143_c0_g1_i16.p1 TRINITY_DN6143_c0_g1~~TRINITY_DN6143_c0_g1_i16.p1  ORF type:complete len:622 (-),score=61.47 TRINITY_DN6143_c0_g1_i16:161-2026(-)